MHLKHPLAAIKRTHPKVNHSMCNWLRFIPYLATVSGPFHSLSRMLRNFPSRYLFAIGLPVIFSLGSGIPANSHSNPKLYYSDKISVEVPVAWLNGAVTLFGEPFQATLANVRHQLTLLVLQFQPLLTADSDWAFPSSLAATMGITVVFFSSA